VVFVYPNEIRDFGWPEKLFEKLEQVYRQSLGNENYIRINKL
jgi:hypothetical protein